MTRAGIRLPSETQPGSVLSISAVERDHLELRSMIDPRLQLIEVCTLSSGLATLAETPVAVVLCSDELRSGSWQDVLEQSNMASDAPNFIVTSRLADETLWAEALNIGAYDVLAKPFEPQEVDRVVAGAWRRWGRNLETAPMMMPARQESRVVHSGVLRVTA